MPSLPPEDQQTFDRLKDELEVARPKFDLADGYYDGAQKLEQLGLAIPDELMKYTVIVNLPRLAVDARTERLEVKSFRRPGQDSGDLDLWRLWQVNDMDEQDMLSRLDFEVYGRSYLCVGSSDEAGGDPIITTESPYQIITERDARTRQITAALRLYDPDATKGARGDDRRATLYLPNETIWLIRDGGQWIYDGEPDRHGLGMVPVCPAFRARRTTLPAFRTLQGTSAMADVIPVTDAAARNLTNAQIGQETHAVPARGVLGATKGDFVGDDGEPLPTWAAYFGSIWSLANKDAKTFQFDASDMKNFETMHDLYMRTGAGLASVPPNYVGLAADDAASADAIRSREARLVRSVELDQIALGNARERAMRIADRLKNGKWDDDLTQMECEWYDAGTPTYASRVDAVVKQYAVTDAAGRPLMSRQSALEELGWSSQRIRTELDRLAEEASDPYLERLGDKG